MTETTESVKVEKSDLIISLIKEGIGNEAAQAFIKIFQREKPIAKLFWTLSLLMSSGVCSFLVANSLINYLNFDTNTSMSTIFETPIQFPKITICNQNQFTTQYAYEFLNEINVKYYPEANLFNQTQMDALNTSQKLNLIGNLYSTANSHIFSKNFPSENKKKLGQPLEEILFNCMFNNLPCTSDDFTWKYDRNYGNCFVFNSGLNSSGQIVDLKQVFLSGQTYGLTIEMYIGFNENLNIINSIAGVGGRS